MFWKRDIFQIFDWVETLAKGREVIIIMNVGHHPHSFNDEVAAKAISAAAKAKFGYIYWKTTNKVRSKLDTDTNLLYPHDQVMCKQDGIRCFNISSICDGIHVNDTLRVDEVHYQSSVYNIIILKFAELLIEWFGKKS